MNTLSRLRSVTCVFFLTLAFSTIARAETEEQAIRACFKNYLEAVAKKDGKTAASLITTPSTKFYGSILNLALNADEAKLRQQRFYRKMMALLVRHEAPDILKQTGNSTNASTFFALIVSKGWGGEVGAPGVELGKIKKELITAASAPVIMNGQETPARLIFEFEKTGGWKFSLLDAIVKTDNLMAERQKNSSVSEDEAILQTLEKRSGRAVTKDIWTPLNQRKAANKP